MKPQKPIHIGFSSKTRCSKLNKLGFTLTDVNLIVEDVINQLNIPIGVIPGDPTIGTSIWDYIFDPNTEETRLKIDTELRRVLSLDTRITIGNIKLFSSEHTVYVDIEIAIKPTNKVVNFSVLFDSRINTATVTTIGQ